MGNLANVLTDICDWLGVTANTTQVNNNLSINYYITSQIKSQTLLQKFCDFTDHFYYVENTNYIFIDRLHSQGFDSSNSYALIHNKTEDDIIQNGLQIKYNELIRDFYVEFNYLCREIVNEKDDIDGQSIIDYGIVTKTFTLHKITNTYMGQSKKIDCYDLQAPYDTSNISTILTRKKDMYENYLNMELTLVEIDSDIKIGNVINFIYDNINFYIYVEDLIYDFKKNMMTLIGIGKKGSVSY